MHDILPPKGIKFGEISDYISLMVQVRDSCNGTLTGNHNHMWPIKLHHCQYP